MTRFAHSFLLGMGVVLLGLAMLSASSVARAGDIDLDKIKRKCNDTTCGGCSGKVTGAKCAGGGTCVCTCSSAGKCQV